MIKNWNVCIKNNNLSDNNIKLALPDGTSYHSRIENSDEVKLLLLLKYGCLKVLTSTSGCKTEFLIIKFLYREEYEKQTQTFL